MIFCIGVCMARFASAKCHRNDKKIVEITKDS
jgi:hypothetical protein